ARARESAGQVEEYLPVARRRQSEWRYRRRALLDGQGTQVRHHRRVARGRVSRSELHRLVLAGIKEAGRAATAADDDPRRGGGPGTLDDLSVDLVPAVAVGVVFAVEAVDDVAGAELADLRSVPLAAARGVRVVHVAEGRLRRRLGGAEEGARRAPAGLGDSHRVGGAFVQAGAFEHRAQRIDGEVEPTPRLDHSVGE